MKLNFFHVFTFFILLVAVFSCKKKEGDHFPDDVKLRFTVVDESENVITGANVYFFNSQADYLNAVHQNNFSGAVASVITSGLLDSVLLKSNREHWVFISWFDPVRNVFLTNVGVSAKIDKLQKGSVINAKFSIKQYHGLVSFWTRDGNTMPIRININGVQQVLNTTMPGAPTSTGNSLASEFNLEEKEYSYYAIAANGCVWTGKVNVQNGGFFPIEFSVCKRSRVAFITNSFNPVHGPINIVLDNNEPIGTINGNGSFTCGTGSQGTGTGSFVSVYRENNTYTYKATSADNNCVWTGAFTLTGEDCQVIVLDQCN
ncbi:MAG: hypothetical protein ACK40G_12515 [Cytophagaceae bacterium]